MHRLAYLLFVLTCCVHVAPPDAVSRRPDPNRTDLADCGNHVECYNEALHSLVDAERLLASAESSLRLVGAVVPFYLSPTEIAAMGPTWVPADGGILNDPKSVFNAQRLPDLRNRFVLGAEATVDVKPASEENETSNPKNRPFSATGSTSGANIDVHANHVEEVFPPEYTIDTVVNETKHGNHTHSVSVSGQMPLPPYRRLVFMIRVRPFTP